MNQSSRKSAPSTPPTRAEGREFAERALARRAMSQRALVTRLIRRGHSPTDAAAIAASLAKQGAINEPALAASLVRTELARKPAGKSLLLTRLRQRGIEDRTARSAVDRAVGSPDYNALEQAVKLAGRRLRIIQAARRTDPEAVNRRLYSLLARRGFDPETCAAAVRKVTNNAADADLLS